MVFATPTLFAKSELDSLRTRCNEQERQIQQLEQENSKLRSGISVPRQVTSVTQPPTSQAATPSDEATYTVKKGDNIEQIAKNLGVSSNSLSKNNGLKNNSIIHPGQTLKIPGKTVTSKTSTPSTPSKTSASSVASTSLGGTYKIRDNDTFSSISRQKKIPVSTLIAANPKVKPTALRTGQIINLGVAKSSAANTAKSTPATSTPVIASKPSQTPKAAAQPRPSASALATHEKPATPAPAATAKSEAQPAKMEAAKNESSTTPISEKKIRPITIDGEMTYGEFAAKHGTDSERLNALNGLDLNNTTVLAKGSELYVPAQP